MGSSGAFVFFPEFVLVPLDVAFAGETILPLGRRRRACGGPGAPDEGLDLAGPDVVRFLRLPPRWRAVASMEKLSRREGSSRHSGPGVARSSLGRSCLSHRDLPLPGREQR